MKLMNRMENDIFVTLYLSTIADYLLKEIKFSTYIEVQVPTYTGRFFKR